MLFTPLCRRVWIGGLRLMVWSLLPYLKRKLIVLEVAFKEEEVLIVLHELNGDKSRGRMAILLPFGKSHSSL